MAISLSNIPNAVTRSLICVDTTESADYSGTLYNPYIPSPTPFGQVRDIIAALENFFNEISYPEPCFEFRSFLGKKREQKRAATLPPQRLLNDDLFVSYRGQLGTFIIEIRSRKNLTWQGTITWQERLQDYAFFSILEMLGLIDNAILSSTLDPHESPPFFWRRAPL